MSTSFWKEALLSLPPEVRNRYAGQLEAAERFERLLDWCAEGWGFATRMLAKGCRQAAHPLRSLAQQFQDAARRFWFTH